MTSLTPRLILNRGYNLMIVAFLFFIGLSMGANAIPEGDFADKIDDLGLLAIGLLAVVWYLTSGRTRRSVVPVVLTTLALAFQVLGVFLEISDKASFGDNIGGMFMLVPFILFAIWQYVRQPALAAESVTAPLAER
ncbi:MAG TPA: hypothetical protein VGN32_03110 [Ktedonobacterales bacterium]|jgi:hypothetical protein|nr:hypothetical protein [Ktedonobacterales bacterium]